MLTSKQRAQLRALAKSIDTIIQIGKTGVGDQLIKQVSDALEARELIKLRVLETSPQTAREAADSIAEAVSAEDALASWERQHSLLVNSVDTLIGMLGS